MNAHSAMQGAPLHGRASPAGPRRRRFGGLRDIWRLLQARRRRRRDLARLLAADDRVPNDTGLDRWAVRRAYGSGAWPPICTAFEVESDKRLRPHPGPTWSA